MVEILRIRNYYPGDCFSGLNVSRYLFELDRLSAHGTWQPRTFGPPNRRQIVNVDVPSYLGNVMGRSHSD